MTEKHHLRDVAAQVASVVATVTDYQMSTIWKFADQDLVQLAELAEKLLRREGIG